MSWHLPWGWKSEAKKRRPLTCSYSSSEFVGKSARKRKRRSPWERRIVSIYHTFCGWTFTSSSCRWFFITLLPLPTSPSTAPSHALLSLPSPFSWIRSLPVPHISIPCPLKSFPSPAVQSLPSPPHDSVVYPFLLLQLLLLPLFKTLLSPASPAPTPASSQGSYQGSSHFPLHWLLCRHTGSSNSTRKKC